MLVVIANAGSYVWFAISLDQNKTATDRHLQVREPKQVNRDA